MSAVLDGHDIEVLGLALDVLDRHTDDELAQARKEGNYVKQAPMIKVRSRLIVLRAKLRTLRVSP